MFKAQLNISKMIHSKHFPAVAGSAVVLQNRQDAGLILGDRTTNDHI